MNRSPERAQFLADIICTAIEGGTNGWATVFAYRWMDRETEQDLPPQEVYAIIGDTEEFYDLDGDLTRQEVLDQIGKKIDIEVIATGISKALSDDFRINGTIRECIRVGDNENDAGMIDADAADVIVQAGLFGEIVFG